MMDPTTVQTYRKLIQAIHFTGDNAVDVAVFIGRGKVAIRRTRPGHLVISAPNGLRLVAPGDFVTRDTMGNVYACKPDIFEQTYELVEQADAP